MPIRESYSDQFNGRADENIRRILSCEDDGENHARRIRRILMKVIDNELTPRQKEIIMLYYFKELNTLQIAERLGITNQAVSASMSRSKNKIFRIMKYYIL